MLLCGFFCHLDYCFYPSKFCIFLVSINEFFKFHHYSVLYSFIPQNKNKIETDIKQR